MLQGEGDLPGENKKFGITLLRIRKISMQQTEPQPMEISKPQIRFLLAKAPAGHTSLRFACTLINQLCFINGIKLILMLQGVTGLLIPVP